MSSFAAYSALSVVPRAQASKKRSVTLTWLAVGAFSMGSGVWAMHFIGMLAFTLPVPTSYNLSITLVSIIPAILGSGFALQVLYHESISQWRLHLSGLLMAVGIGTMHYIGMEAMRMDARLFYDPMLFAISILVAYALASTALYIKFIQIKFFSIPAFWKKIGSAVLMGIAVTGMHYTAMSAALFYPGPGVDDSTATFTPQGLSAIISAITFLIVGLVIIGTLIDSRLAIAARFSGILEIANEAIISLNQKQEIIIFNNGAEQIFGYSAQEILGKSIDLLLPERFRGGHFDQIVEFSNSTSVTRRMGLRREIYGQRKNSEEFPAEGSITVLKLGDEAIFTVVLQDITERKQGEETLRRYERIVSSSSDLMAFVDKNYIYRVANDAYCQSLRKTEEEIIGHSVDEILGIELFETRVKPKLDQCFSGTHANFQQWLDLPNLGKRYLDVHYDPYHDSNGSISGAVVDIRDITKSKETSELLANQAIRDPLTDLYNRRFFNKRIQEEITSAKKKGHRLAVLMCDLDHFKNLNDTMGHQAGDEALRAIAKAINRAIRGVDMAFRWGGDEIVVLLSNTTQEGVLIVAERIRGGVCKIGDELSANALDVSIGIALYPDHGETPEKLVRLADRALYIAKKGGGDKIHIGEEEFQLKDGTIKAAFQPIMDVRLNSPIGFEALGRDAKGKLSILDLFKKYQAIGLLKELKILCFRKQMSIAQEVGIQKVFINIDFKVLENIQPEAIPPGMDVVLEISEGEALYDIENHLKIANKWREKGYKFAIDDFGAGFISLPFIAKLNPEHIKLDRSTVIQAVESEAFRRILKDLLVGLRNCSTDGIIAEGIETKKELSVMKDLGVYLIQGYLFGKPKEFN